MFNFGVEKFIQHLIKNHKNEDNKIAINTQILQLRHIKEKYDLMK